MSNKPAYKIEELACRVNDTVQILHYVYDEVAEHDTPEDRQPTNDDIYSRVPTLLYKVKEELKDIREELFNTFNEIR